MDLVVTVDMHRALVSCPFSDTCAGLNLLGEPPSQETRHFSFVELIGRPMGYSSPISEGDGNRSVTSNQPQQFNEAHGGPLHGWNVCTVRTYPQERTSLSDAIKFLCDP
jgi:hypothetical protein